MAVGRFGYCLEKCLNIFNANTWHCWDSVESQHRLPQSSFQTSQTDLWKICRNKLV